MELWQLGLMLDGCCTCVLEPAGVEGTCPAGIRIGAERARDNVAVVRALLASASGQPTLMGMSLGKIILSQRLNAL